MRALPIWALMLATGTAAGATAQDLGPTEARARAARAIDCLEPLLTRLTTTLRLLREAQAQLDAPGENARRDAAHAIVSLEQQIDDLGESLRSCVPHGSRLEPHHRVEGPSGADARVGHENPATHELERDVQLTTNVRVAIGERVDGHGSLPGQDVRRMVSRIGGRLESCYGELVDRGALQHGQLVLAFTVDASGRVQRVSVEASTISNRRFQQCVERAGQSIAPGATPTGGDVRFAYTLRFGSD